MQVIILIIINAKLLYVAYFYGGPWSRIFGIRYQRLYVRKRGFVYKKGRLSDKCTAREVFPNLSTAEGRLQSGKTTSRIGWGWLVDKMPAHSPGPGFNSYPAITANHRAARGIVTFYVLVV